MSATCSLCTRPATIAGRCAVHWYELQAQLAEADYQPRHAEPDLFTRVFGADPVSELRNLRLGGAR